MKAKTLIESLLKDLDPKAEIEVIISQDSKEGMEKGRISIVETGYRDGKFIIKVVEWT